MTCYITISEESNFGPNRRVAEFAPVIPQFDTLRFPCDTHTWEACSLPKISPFYARGNIVTQVIQMIQNSLEMHQER